YHDEDAGGDDPGGDDPGGIENTASVFYILGNPAYQVTTWGDLEQFKQKLQDRSPEEEPGANIATGTTFYYRGDYYLFRDYQYITGGTDLSAYIAGYGVKINNTVFTTPSAASQPGDIKLVDGKVYVFFPYSHSRYDGDYNNAGWWYEIALTP
ncbi:MAG: hypothetical protein GX572_01510, partial [Clostridia bacterium]|nr:hypothetical protein [Clostridia bacterium]